MKTFAKRFGIGQWSFIGPGSEKKWYPSENSPQGAWDHVAEDMLLKFAESGHPIFRSTTPLSRGKLKSKGKGKVSIHFSADQDTVATIYRIILSVNQLSIYGAVAAICDEYEGHQDSTGQPGLFILLRIMKWDAGFLRVVEIGQYFMTKDTGEQFFARAGREYTLPRSYESSQPKDGFRETRELHPYWKLRPVVYTTNMELKLESGL